MKVFSIIFVIALSLSQVLAVDEDAVVARVLAALEKGILTVVQNHWYKGLNHFFEDSLLFVFLYQFIFNINLYFR